METPQNVALNSKPTDVSDADEANRALSIRHQAWIDYNALNGLITDVTEDRINPKTGEPMILRKMTIQEFADIVGVDRKTLQRWRVIIPNFWQRVNDRRQELAPQARLQRMHEVWYLSALRVGTEGFRDRQMWLANFDKSFHMPTQPVEHEIGGGLADVLEIARKRGRETANIPEGEVINATDTSANA